jgi:peptide/nickel transport system ATP-binding protein
MNHPILSARITVDYLNRPGVLQEVPLTIHPGEVVGLVGQSGSGKSTFALACLRLLDRKGARAHGELGFRGEDLLRRTEREMRRIRGKHIGLVLQSPLSALNPALTLGRQIEEAWKAHEPGNLREGKQRIRDLLEQVALPAEEEFLKRYPRQISVGQAQRLLIAMAVLHRPALLIADEPTSALDVITQSEILALFSRLNRELGVAILFISHDLLSVANLCHRVTILKGGQVVEEGPVDRIFHTPTHPYTQRLIAALPRNPFEPASPLAALQRALEPGGTAAGIPDKRSN